jgi:hypothetical protein
MCDMICEIHGETGSLKVSKRVSELIDTAKEPIPQSVLTYVVFPFAKGGWLGFWALKEELTEIGPIASEDADDEDLDKNMRLLHWMHPYCQKCFAEVFGDAIYPPLPSNTQEGT